MSLTKWNSFLLLSLGLTLIAWSWLNRPKLCLNSMVVERIDSVGGERTLVLPQCGKGSGASYSAKLLTIKEDLEARLKKLELSLENRGLSFDPARLVILESDEPMIRMYPEQLVISRSLLDKDQTLEKHLMMVLLSQSLSTPLSPEQVLWTEVFSDLWVKHVFGNRKSPDDHRLMWPFSLSTLENYCQSSWRSSFDLAKCETGQLKANHLVSGLREILINSMSDSLSNLGFRNQALWFTDVLSNWPSRQFQLSSSGTENQSNTEQIRERALELRNWLKQMQTWSSGSASWSQMAAETERALIHRGFRDEGVELIADLIIFKNEDQKSPEWLGLEEAIPTLSGKKILLLSEKSLRLFPQNKEIPADWVLQMKARQGLLVQCSIPSTEQLKRVSNKVEKLLLVRLCDPKMVVNWRALKSNSFDDFIAANPKLSFVQFHLPSLAAALSKKNLNPVLLIEKQLWGSDFFQEIGWQDPEWDKKLKAFRTRSAIEAIEMFRVEGPSSLAF